MSDSSLLLPSGLRLRTRNLVTAYVNHSKSTGLWITQINLEERVNKKGVSQSSARAFSFRSENEAKETAYVNAPPKMIIFDMVSNCFGCESKFNQVFRRPAHCRNCGVCICPSCSTTWSKAMIPETYNTKKKRSVKVCRTCDYLSTKFRHALMSGDFKAAKRIYMTGNINLRCPFSNIKRGNEVMLPLHCAVAGGNLEICIWMADVHHCPFQMINTGNNKQMTSTLISTSKGRNVIDIALDHRRIDVLKYLINQKNLPISKGNGEKQNPMYDTLQLLLKTQVDENQFEPSSPSRVRRMPMSPRTPTFKKNVVRVRGRGVNTPRKDRASPSRPSDPPHLPCQTKTKNDRNFRINTPSPSRPSDPPHLSCQTKTLRRVRLTSSISTTSESSSESENPLQQKVEKQSLNLNTYRTSRPSSLNTGIPTYRIADPAEDDFDDSDMESVDGSSDDNESVATTVEDKCIICYDQSIDCVFIPCGHQICCLKCSSHLSKCPICSSRASVIKIFRP